MSFDSDDELLHPFEAWLSADSEEVLRVDRDADERCPRFELDMKPSHRRVVPDLYSDGHVIQRSREVLYVPR
jgi:hypothetical protein